MPGWLASAVIAVALGLGSAHAEPPAPAVEAPSGEAEASSDEAPPAAPAPSAEARPAVPPPSGEAIERARKQVLDERYQPELPRYQTGSGGDGVARQPRRMAGGELDEAERERRAMIDARERDGGGSPLVTTMMWGLIIVVAVLIGFWLVSELSRYGGDAELEPEAGNRGPSEAVRAAVIERPLGDADELARRGEFAEAIHTLLLRTLQELARSAAVRVAPATTSREILARVPLLADARDALAGLITAVEITHFGDEPANAADYERCRQQFHVFAAAFRGVVASRPEAVAA